MNYLVIFYVLNISCGKKSRWYSTTIKSTRCTKHPHVVLLLYRGMRATKCLWSFFSKKKYNHTYTGFVDWLNNFVAFEWLKITPINEKDSAIKKVFLTEFQFKKRWYLPIDSKWWFYLKYHNNRREIDYSNVLYENWWRQWACTFYNFDHCQ